jgi:hypothetical protein
MKECEWYTGTDTNMPGPGTGFRTDMASNIIWIMRCGTSESHRQLGCYQEPLSTFVSARSFADSMKDKCRRLIVKCQCFVCYWGLLVERETYPHWPSYSTTFYKDIYHPVYLLASHFIGVSENTVLLCRFLRGITLVTGPWFIPKASSTDSVN